jgi:Fic family protein
MDVGKRAYEESHPWIKFTLDLRELQAQFWLLLGEAQAMVEQIASAPIRPALRDRFHLVYLAKGAQATTAIEGNTLSEAEVLAQVEGQLKVPPSREYQKQEVDNIICACETVWKEMREGGVAEWTAERIKQFNRWVLKDLKNLEDGVVPGEVPRVPIVVGVYRGAPREDCEYLLDRLASELNGMSDSVWPEWTHSTRTGEAVLKAVFAHLHIAWIHPFGDGNGRTARLMEYQLLAAARVPSPVAHLLSNHYNATRTDYYRLLRESSKHEHGLEAFLMYAVRGFVDGLSEHVELVRQEQMQLAWHSYVLDTFRPMKQSTATRRQRDLLLDLSRQGKPIPRDSLRVMSERVSKQYEGTTPKTLTRDLNTLLGRNLIREDADGYVANVDVMLDFTPFRREECFPTPEPLASSTDDEQSPPP